MNQQVTLVDIRARFPALAIDLKYASADNITGQHLQVLDAYRPQQAQQLLWNACPNQDYVVPIALGSNHSRGTAIDVTLLDESGQRQRIAIARALSAKPDIIVLDEPTSALDISVQAQILNLLVELQKQQNLTFVLISHNVSVVRHMSDRVAVMYLGQIVEMGEARRVLDAPSHPYTRLLMDSVPRIGAPLGDAPRNTELPGNRHLPEGCYFRERCPYASAGCEQPQPLRPLANGTSARCWKAESLAVTAA